MVAPATADLMAKMANGHADDLASAVLLATDKPVLLAPAMNPRMWATRRPGATSRSSSPTASSMVGPNAGEMAESGEAGAGRMAEPLEIVAAMRASARGAPPRKPLAGKRIVDHVRADARADRPGALYRQPLVRQAGPCDRGAAAAAGAEVTLVSGPVTCPIRPA